MKAILYMATTANGYIGLTDGNSDWVSEADEISFLDHISSNKVLTYLESKGCSSAMLIGERETNTAFFEDNLIDEIKLIVHPLIFGDEMQLFHKSNTHLKLELLKSETLEKGLVNLHYKIVK